MSFAPLTVSDDFQAVDIAQITVEQSETFNQSNLSEKDLKDILSATAGHGRALQAACEGDTDQNLENYFRKLGEIDGPTTLLIEPFAETSRNQPRISSGAVAAAVAALTLLHTVVTQLIDAINKNKEVFHSHIRFRGLIFSP